MSIRLVKVGQKAILSQSQQRELAFAELRGLLRDLFRVRFEGGAYSKLAMAQGYADGYMRMMNDLGLATDAELLSVIAEVRRGGEAPIVSSRVTDDAGLNVAEVNAPLDVSQAIA